MPTIVSAQLVATKNADAAQGEFYDAWPDLNNDKARPAVASAVHAYRAANPRANLQDVIQQAGVMAMLNLGLDPTAKKKEAAKPPAAKPKKPAKPAGAGSSSPNPPVTGGVEENVFSQLARLHDEENN